MELYQEGLKVLKKIFLFLILFLISLPSYGLVKLVKESVLWANLESHRVLHLSCDDNTDNTTVLDTSGNGYHGTAQQDTCDINVAGKIGGALSFNGTTDYVDANNTFQTTFQFDSTISVWIKKEPSVSFYYIPIGTSDATQDNTVNLCFDLVEDVERVAFYHINSSGTLTVIASNTSVADGNWHLITVTVEQTESKVYGKIYIDAVLTASSDETMLLSSYSNGSNLYVGCNNWNGSTTCPYEGYLDDVRIYDIALSQRQVGLLWNGGNGR